jgi:hypothetical protein
MKAKLIRNAVIVNGEDVYTLLDRGFGSKFFPSSAKASNKINIETSSSSSSSNHNTCTDTITTSGALMTIRLSLADKSQEDENKQEEEEGIDRLILRNEEVDQSLSLVLSYL